MTYPILQVSSQYFGQFGNAIPAWAVVLLILFAIAVVGALIVAGVRSRRVASPAQQAKLTRRSFARTARSLGLDRDQTAMLEKLVAVCRVKQPMMVFTNPGLLDDVLKRGVYALESAGTPEAKKQEKLRAIYLTKQIIENAVRSRGVENTLGLKPGLQLTIAQEGAATGFTVKLVANTKEILAVSTPRDKGGGEQRWPKGSRCVVGFSRESDAGYTFPSKVIGYSTLKGESCMLLQHAKTMRKDQQRRSRRKELSRPCFVYPVKITEVGKGRKAERKAVVMQHEKVIGTVTDISAGGCSVRAREPFKKGTLVKVELSIGRKDTVAAFGKVQRVRPERQGGAMHIMFTRLSATALNRIYSYVYDYTAIG